MGNHGIRLKTPLTATGNTAPEANLETALSSACELDSLPPEAASAGAEISRGLSSTAEAAPPT